MRSIIPYIIYPWLAVSIVVYVRRFMRRREEKLGPTSPPPSTSTASTGLLRKDRTPRPAPEAPRDRPPTSTPVVPHVPRIAPPDLPTAPPRTDEAGRPMLDATHYPLEPAVAAALRDEGKLADDGDDGDDTATPGRAGLFARAEPEAAAQRAPLADLLEGIALPCDLAPLVSLEQAHMSDLSATFRTSGHEAAAVGAALGDELERLGFSLASVSEHQVRASRADGTLLVTLHDRPDTLVDDEGARTYPTTAEGDVVVEVVST